MYTTEDRVTWDSLPDRFTDRVVSTSAPILLLRRTSYRYGWISVRNVGFFDAAQSHESLDTFKQFHSPFCEIVLEGAGKKLFRRRAVTYVKS